MELEDSTNFCSFCGSHSMGRKRRSNRSKSRQSTDIDIAGFTRDSQLQWLNWTTSCAKSLCSVFKLPADKFLPVLTDPSRTNYCHRCFRFVRDLDFTFNQIVQLHERLKWNRAQIGDVLLKSASSSAQTQPLIKPDPDPDPTLDEGGSGHHQQQNSEDFGRIERILDDIYFLTIKTETDDVWDHSDSDRFDDTIAHDHDHEYAEGISLPDVKFVAAAALEEGLPAGTTGTGKLPIVQIQIPSSYSVPLVEMVVGAKCPEKIKKIGNSKTTAAAAVVGERRYFACTYEACAGKMFRDQSAFNKHLGSVHLPPRYFCEKCDASFREGFKLKRHNLIHTGEQNFHCPYRGCSKSFSLEYNLTTHIRIHTGDKPYVCPVCSKRFTQATNLKSHLKNIHTRPNKPKSKRKAIGQAAAV